jgi:membrane dipeptidase
LRVTNNDLTINDLTINVPQERRDGGPAGWRLTEDEYGSWLKKDDMYKIVDLLNGSRIDGEYAETCLAHGVICVHVTVNNFSRIDPLPDLRGGLRELAACRRHYKSLESCVRIVEGFSDIDRAQGEGKLAVILGYQNLPGIERDLELLELYRALGVRIMQFAHNVRNLYGDGCAEPGNAGISSLGGSLIGELNRQRILIDISHVGDRAALDIIEISRRPVMATHANAFSVCDNVRNKSDGVLDALKRASGLIGITYLPPLVRKEVKPSHAELSRHVAHVRDRIGIDHLALGSDFITGQPAERYEEFMRRPDVYGTWPWRFPVEDVRDQQRWLKSLGDIGLSDEEINQLAGSNALRVLEQTWKN